MSNQEQWSAKQYQEYHKKKHVTGQKAARLKFRNQHTIIDGITFDSKKEAEYYGQCKLREKIGQLIKFEYHVVFKLEIFGRHICNYEADFVLYHPNGTITVVDVKGPATEALPVFQIKKALMKALHDIDIQIV